MIHGLTTAAYDNIGRFRRQRLVLAYYSSFCKFIPYIAWVENVLKVSFAKHKTAYGEEQFEDFERVLRASARFIDGI